MSDLQATVAALHALEHVRGGRLELDPHRPDATERNQPAVDFLARGPGRVVAIEHTQVGAFAEQEQLSAEMRRHLAPMCATLEGQLPDPASYQVTVSAQDAPRIGSQDVLALHAWIADTAPRLSAPPNHYEKTPAGLVPATLYRWPRRGVGPQLDLTIGVQTGPELETLRHERICRALASKLPKLEAARATLGATETLLVLESLDLQISNAWEIAASVRACMDERPMPDHVVIVDPTSVWALVVDGQWRELARIGRSPRPR